MKTSERMVSMIAEWEGFRGDAYVCPAGVLTIGYGHTNGVKRGDRMTKVRALELLREDLAVSERSVNCMQVALLQRQFDALVSFVFNVGTEAFRSSTIRRIVSENPDDERIAGEFKRWDKAGGVRLEGLARRRQAEADYYFGRL